MKKNYQYLDDAKTNSRVIVEFYPSRDRLVFGNNGCTMTRNDSTFKYDPMLLRTILAKLKIFKKSNYSNYYSDLSRYCFAEE